MAALVLDLFCTPLVDVAPELTVPAYVYFTCNAAALSFFMCLPSLCEEASEFGEMDGAAREARVPGTAQVDVVRDQDGRGRRRARPRRR